ncbi:glycosyltransferase WbuB, partial [Desulfobacteraceae bacterium SEEP-SAG9]
IFLPLQPEEIVPQVWASADISLVTSKKGLSNDSVPSKTYAIMASARPIIAMVDENSEVWNIVKESRGGINVPSEQPKLLVDAILKLYGNKTERLIMGNNGRKYAERHFSPEVINQKYESFFGDVLDL